LIELIVDRVRHLIEASNRAYRNDQGHSGIFDQLGQLFLVQSYQRFSEAT
jgi:hypothetical protein